MEVDAGRGEGSRLELDDEGRVLDGGRPTHALDLADASAAVPLSASPADAWIEHTLRPWAARHRRALSAIVTTTLVLLIGALWWTHQPPPAAPARAQAPLLPLSVVAPAVSVVEVHLDATPGSSVVGVRLVVRNASGADVTLATERRADGVVEFDTSQSQTLRAGSTVLLTTRVLVHDCTSAPAVRPLREEPRPVMPGTPSAADTNPGVALRIGVGTQTALASYALPVSVASWRADLHAAACAHPPAVSAHFTSASGGRKPDGSWYVDGVLAVHTSGIGVGTGLEQFSGPAWGSGSELLTTNVIEAGSLWSMTPIRLDGGAGHLTVHFTGASCAPDVARAPTTLPVYVLDASQGSYPFVVPLTTPVLAHAVAQVCERGSSGAS